MADEIEKGTPPSVPAVKAGEKRPGPGRPPKNKLTTPKPKPPEKPNDDDDDEGDAESPNDGAPNFLARATQALDGLLGV